MPIIHPPQYTKITQPDTRVVEACYTFRVTMEDSDTPLMFLVEESSPLVSSMIVSCLQENRTWWEGFLRHFLERSSKFFSKTYTVPQLLPIMTHMFTVSGTVDGPSTVFLSPHSLQIRGGTFCVFWEHTCESLVIDIPVESLPVETECVDLLEISEPPFDLPECLTLDSSVPVGTCEEVSLQEIPLSPTENACRLRDRQKAKEARLKAKLAIYRAQTELNEYYDKYGTDLSDSDASDSDTKSDVSRK